MSSVPIQKQAINKCPMCKSIFVAKKNLYAHMRKLHNLEVVVHNKPKAQQYQCNECSKLFEYKHTLERHIKTLHVKESDHDYSTANIKSSRLLCPENCPERCPSYSGLRQHLSVAHSIEIEMETVKFSCIEEFKEWKTIIEQQTCSVYSRDTAQKKLSNGVQKQYFNCHRSHGYKPKGKNIRRLKSLGSSKIGKACPSRIELTIINTPTRDVKPEVTVKFWKTHCGHEFQLGHTFLDRETKDEIALKLMDGTSFDDILDSLRSSDCYNRLSLISRNDLHNIVRDYDIKMNIKHESIHTHPSIMDTEDAEFCGEGINYMENESLLTNASTVDTEDALFHAEGIKFLRDESILNDLSLTDTEDVGSCETETILLEVGSLIKDEENPQGGIRTISKIDLLINKDTTTSSTDYENQIALDPLDDSQNDVDFSDILVNKAECIIQLCGKVRMRESSAKKIGTYLDIVIRMLNKGKLVSLDTLKNSNVQKY